LKSFLDFASRRRWSFGLALLVAIVTAAALRAEGELPAWIRNIEAKSDVERAFFRAMKLPYGEVLFRRPPAETRPALGVLIAQHPGNAELYSLRALEDEQQLDFSAAEADWKLYADNASNKIAAQWDLAYFYHRRLRPQDEIATLRTIGNSPGAPGEKLTPTDRQQAWRAFERILAVIQAQAVGKEATLATYRAWIARYPQQEQLYSQFLDYLVAEREFDQANQLIASYQKQFPADVVFPVKASALVQYRRDSIEQGLAVYEKSFQPLWQPELVKGYFDLLGQTQGLRKFLNQARADLSRNPEDLNATARVFYYYQQQGKLDAAEQAITSLRLHKEATNSPWSPQDLYTCGRLLEDIHADPEAARFYFALYNSQGAPDSQERALTRLSDMLLTSPESGIRLGTGDLSMYKDVATMDPGPGYLNGILSLILNTTSPQSAYSDEDQRAVSYFHRSRAVELLALVDKNYPNAEARPELHAKVIQFYSDNGQSEAVLAAGKEFLASFPKSAERTRVALLMADADARLQQPEDEFAIYDRVLQELASDADHVPLGDRAAGGGNFRAGRFEHAEGQQSGEDQESQPAASQPPNGAFQVDRDGSAGQTGPRSVEYSRVLERYIARLVELKQVPQALGVLRREIDRNPDDPGLYEHLAMFLEQNNLSAEQEEVYRRAFARFSDPSWYSKLARLYLRYRKYAELETLTQDAVKQFDGSVLENYFGSVRGGTPAMYVRLNQYAIQKFPHNPYFVRNLLGAYHSRQTYDQVAWLALIREHWFEDPGLRDQYFEYLSSSNQLDDELGAVQRSVSRTDSADSIPFMRNDPAAARELADAEIWRSHFEQSAPVMKELAQMYPADRELDRNASSIFRSLAYFDSSKTDVAAKIEENLLAAYPGDTEILARIGDIYSDREQFQQAAPYWERIPKIAPGDPRGYLEAATIYWDYYDFSDALRLMDQGRSKLARPALYGYEEGAIYETEGDYPRAIREYAEAALADGEQSQAMSRLLALARRPNLRDLVNDASEKLATDSHDTLPAIRIRVRVLEAENRRPDMAAFLGAALDHSDSIEQAAEIETIAGERSLEAVREKALEKQAMLARDPVTQMQLRYALVQFYEGKKDIPAAQRNIDQIYQSNPKILGVVRSTVDFYWRVKLYAQAIAVLRKAASDAYPQLSAQFTFEAARKSTEANDPQQARALLDGLLKSSPYDSQYLAAMADTYSRQGDAAGLKQFYLGEIELFRSASLGPDERKNQIATLRRGLIPALTQLKDYSGAVDQFIGLINSFSEDDALSTEAALYAQQHQREKQLLDYYSHTIQQSPRDYRWPMVLARVESSLEEFPEAVDSYGKALTIRPDRTDLRIARASLEERLERFDDAATDYDRLYQLTYKDPQWMEKVAEVRARQGRVPEAVAALKTALIDGAPVRAGNYFEVARRLEAWGILAPARNFAEQGVSAAGDDLLASQENHDGARIYMRIMTRLRQQQKAYATLKDAMSSASDPLQVLKEQAAKQGIAGLTDQQWRDHVLEIRERAAREGMRAAMTEMGSTAARYFTPEEKTALSDLAGTLRMPMSDRDAKDFALPLVEAAGLSGTEAQLRDELLRSTLRTDRDWMGQLNAYVQLERRRLSFAELGPEMANLARAGRTDQYAPAIEAAAHSYQASGDEDGELQMLSALGPNRLGGADRARWFALLLKKDPQQLVQVASSWSAPGQQAADFALANGDAELAHAVVAARSKARPPVWEKSYNALVGLYFAENSQVVDAAFAGAVGDQTIGGRLGKPVDRDAQLAGDIWFYYASRYGEYMAATKRPASEDFLPAELEHSPASGEPHLSLGDYYLDQGNNRRAIEQYKYTLELSPASTAVHDKLAIAYFKDKNRAAAIVQWKLFFSAQLAEVENVRLPDDFWTDFGRACDHVQSRGLFADVGPDVDKVVRAYLHRNGNYRSNALLESAYLTQGDPSSATRWLLDVSLSAPDPTSVLEDIAGAPWVPLASRAPIYQRILDLKQAAAAKLEGEDLQAANTGLRSWQVRWVEYLVDTKRYADAAQEIDALKKDHSSEQVSSLGPAELECAAKLGTLDAKISSYQSNQPDAPSTESLRLAASRLLKTGEKQSARKILEFVYSRDMANHEFVATNFLGLAEARIDDGDTPGAVAVLKRLVLVAGDPYENMDSSAALLEKTGHPAEAIEFLEPLASCTPWEPGFRLRLAKARVASGKDKSAAADSLAKLSADPDNPYALRVLAATALAGFTHAHGFGSAELELLAQGPKSITPAAADHPFFVDARLAAAENAANPRNKMEILEKALADSPSNDAARLAFFRAAASTGADQLALASIERFLERRMFGQAPVNDSSDRENSADAGNDSTAISQVQTSSTLALEPAEETELTHEIALAMIRVGRLEEAVGYLQIDRKLEISPEERKLVASEILDLEARLRLERTNAAREPILHADLEQGHLVRPRLVARATAPKAAAAAEAGKP
jgi:cellulose synthase operon protein C